MDKPTLKEAIKLFEPLGSIRARTMFGGFGVFADKTMFALVVGETLYLRTGKENKALFEQFSLEPYRYAKRGFPVVTKYFQVDESWWLEPETLLEYGRVALSIARKEQEKKEKEEITRLKDLPNLRLATERMLVKAGIGSAQELKDVGAAEAFLKVQASHDQPLKPELLWALEGAINGTHWSVVPASRREELLNIIKQ